MINHAHSLGNRIVNGFTHFWGSAPRLQAGACLLLILFDLSGCAKHDPYEDGVVTIGIYADSGAAPACVTAAMNMFRWMNHRVELMYVDDLNYGDLSHIDLFYFPGGNSEPYMRMISADGRNNLQDLIRDGRGYIGTCAGAMYAAEVQTWRGRSYTQGLLGIFPGTAIGPIDEIHPYPTYGMCWVNLVKSHPVAAGEPDSMWIMYYWGPHLVPNSEKDVEVVGRYAITGQKAFVTCRYGKGRVFLTGPHPEWEEDDSRDSVSSFKNFDDKGSDWPLMKSATEWCLGNE